MQHTYTYVSYINLDAHESELMFGTSDTSGKNTDYNVVSNLSIADTPGIMKFYDNTPRQRPRCGGDCVKNHRGVRNIATLLRE